jgi:ERCC4-type nuclease
MIEMPFARNFAHEWIEAFNSHDIKKIMPHYSDDINFTSPIIQKLQVHAEGFIGTKEKLKTYFEKALLRFPDLKFELISVFPGINSIVIYYKSVNNMLAAEYMELNASGLITKVNAHYIFK